MGSVDRRVESEDSGDEEGKRKSSSVNFDERSLRDKEERKQEDLQGTGHAGDLGPPRGLGEAGWHTAAPGWWPCRSPRVGFPNPGTRGPLDGGPRGQLPI